MVLVDDSIVRGTTSTKIVGMVRAAGAAEVHMRIASPPTTHSCFYGVDSLAFLSIDGLYRAVGEARRDDALPQYCDACFTGDYPTRLTDLAERHLAEAQLQFPVDKVA